MNVHSSARSTRAGRALLVHRVNEEHWSVAEAADAAGVSPRTVYNWLAPPPGGGRRGAFLDRSSRPNHSPTAVSAGWQEMILQFRWLRMTGTAIRGGG